MMCQIQGRRGGEEKRWNRRGNGSGKGGEPHKIASCCLSSESWFSFYDRQLSKLSFQMKSNGQKRSVGEEEEEEPESDSKVDEGNGNPLLLLLLLLLVTHS